MIEIIIIIIASVACVIAATSLQRINHKLDYLGKILTNTATLNKQLIDLRETLSRMESNQRSKDHDELEGQCDAVNEL